MPIAHKVDEQCPRCESDDDVWMFEKEEPTIIKEHYTCETCGCELTEKRT
ncbi:Zn finger [Halorubrum virus HRTV-24]|nr:Zn finger [Halorubrum virus HRTV-24]